MQRISNNTPNKEALNAFQALNKKGNIDKINVIETLKVFQKYLVSLCEQLCKNKLKPNYCYHMIFANSVYKKDYKSYCKANIAVASESLNRILFKIEKDELNEFKIRFLKDFICDLKSYIKIFDSQQDYSWLLGNTNSHITNFYFDLARNIFWNGIPSDHQEERLVLATTTPFIIRQSIEYKIKRILGIDYILVNEKPDIRSTEKFFNPHCSKNH